MALKQDSVTCTLSALGQVLLKNLIDRFPWLFQENRISVFQMTFPDPKIDQITFMSMALQKTHGWLGWVLWPTLNANAVELYGNAML